MSVRNCSDRFVLLWQTLDIPGIKGFILFFVGGGSRVVLDTMYEKIYTVMFNVLNLCGYVNSVMYR